MPGAGDYGEQVQWYVQTSTKGTSGAENEGFALRNGVNKLWCAFADAEPAKGIPASRAKTEELVEDDRILSVQRCLIRVREYWDISTKDRLRHTRTGLLYDVTGVRFGTNETLVNAEISGGTV